MRDWAGAAAQGDTAAAWSTRSRLQEVAVVERAAPPAMTQPLKLFTEEDRIVSADGKPELCHDLPWCSGPTCRTGEGAFLC